MCARFLTPAQAAAERYWKTIAPLWHFSASWRVLPTQQIPIVLALEGVITGRMMRWGLIPSSGPSEFPLINAKAENLQTGWPWKFQWKGARRCLLVMAGFHGIYSAESNLSR